MSDLEANDGLVPAVLALCGDAPRDMGFRVLEARNAPDALELAQDGPAVDLLPTDVVIPSMSGPELAAQITTRHGNPAAIFMSGDADDTVDGSRGLALTDILRKPFTEQQLSEAIVGQLKNRAAQQEEVNTVVGKAGRAGD